MVASAWKSGQGRWVGILSLGAIVLGATGVFIELKSALDIIWKAPAPPKAVAALVRARLLSFGLVVGSGFLIVVLLIADAAIAYVTGTYLTWRLARPLLGLIQPAVSFCFLGAAFTCLLKALPDIPVRWRDAAGGAAAAALLFTGGKHGFALYLAHAGTANAFGAASSLAVLMMWLFFSSAVFLFGAELAARLSYRFQ